MYPNAIGYGPLATLLQRAASDSGKCPIHIYTAAYPLRPHPSVCGRQRTAGPPCLKSSSFASRTSPHHYSQGMEAGIHHAPCRTSAGTGDTCFRIGTFRVHLRKTKFEGMVVRTWKRTWAVIKNFSA